jgi:hypothetical protein
VRVGDGGRHDPLTAGKGRNQRVHAQIRSFGLPVAVVDVQLLPLVRFVVIEERDQIVRKAIVGFDSMLGNHLCPSIRPSG